jgi:site-specific recombinase XerD
LNTTKPKTEQNNTLNDFIFPILNAEKHLSLSQKDNRIKKMNKMVNKDLKEIAELAKIDFNLTTYVARHTYATVLKRSGVSTSIISEALGHDSEKTTQIYLDSFDNAVIDEADKFLV